MAVMGGGRGMAVNRLIMRARSPQTGCETGLERTPSLTVHGPGAVAYHPGWTPTAHGGLTSAVDIEARLKADIAEWSLSVGVPRPKTFPQTRELPPADTDRDQLTLNASFRASAALADVLRDTTIEALFLVSPGLLQPTGKSRTGTAHGCS
ncbi:hypothetical protein GCM10012286_61640 [Streptomyces lasiicapitis]|uniref:Uncharacterized protein n=1 Tax=Streptomyces lasiicapitis TaxID=1923961 RepID=A0ABQ2MP37_9ACTN|nr:hypothetical protein GCM10012286_61640 [Streptomyces lasiicapitis]